MARLLKPPAPLPDDLGPSVFLAGTIDMGAGDDTVHPFNGDDYVYGGRGVDTLLLNAIDGALTRRRSTLRGAITIDANWTAGEGEALFDARAEFDDVVLDQLGCPIGGTLTLSGALVGSTAGPASISRSFAFGPECGDVVVLR